jgi:ABC-type transporter Mla subunit MlaD
VSITPGDSGRQLPSGAVLPLSQSDPYVDVDRLLSVLRGPTRDRARELIRSLGSAVRGRGEELNGTIRGVSGTFIPLAHVVHILNSDRAQVAQLVKQFGDVAAAAGERGASIKQIAHEGLTTFQALAARDDALRALLRKLPGTLSSVRTTATTLRSVSGTATPVLTNLAAALHDVGPAVDALRPAAQQGREVVRELGAAAPGLETTLRRVRQLASPAARALPELKATLCQVNPVLRYARPYTADVNSFLSSFGSASNSYDAIGHLVRITPILNDNSLNGLPPSVSQAALTLLHAGLLSKSTALTWEPYPAPGQVGKASATGKPPILGPKETPKTGYVFPHITADC